MKFLQIFISVQLISFSFAAENVTEAFKTNEVVPDVIATPPGELLSVAFGPEEAKLGNELTPTQVKDQPIVKWAADPNKFYTLSFTDPDARSRQNPTSREWKHWLVGNIPGDQVDKGDVLSAYISSAPPKGSGLHRYVFLVFEQPGKLTFDEPRQPNNSADNRGKFSTTSFANKYKLGNPIAGNFYQAQHDSYVEVVYAGLKLKK